MSSGKQLCFVTQNVLDIISRQMLKFFYKTKAKTKKTFI